MLYKMGHLAHSADVRTSQVEAITLGMIEREIVATLAPLRADMRDHKLALYDLTVRVAACEKTQGASDEVTALKADITRVDDVVAESEAEIDEKHLGVTDAADYDDLADLDGARVHTNVQASLRDVSMVDSS
uniref:Polyprotein protein n=1 Tax=Solanum tuberosum TaxID=4113 RepID=M1DBM9_SOLTU